MLIDCLALIQSNIEKVLRAFQGEKSRKDMDDVLDIKVSV